MRLLQFFLFLIPSVAIWAQESPTRISISFSNESTLEIIERIEEISPFRFYFLEGWIADETHSGTYRDAAIEDVLNPLFSDANINYYILEDTKVILTDRNVIRDQLPDGFFDLDEEGEALSEERAQEGRNAPILVNPEKTNIPGMETFEIGKEDSGNRENYYTLKGRILRMDDGQPVADAVVRVPDTEIGVTADDAGSYEIVLPPGPSILEVTAIGLVAQRLQVVMYNDGELSLEMPERVEMLDEVVVEGDDRLNVEQAIAGVTQVEIERIKTIPLVLGERDILKAAVTLPGISTAGEGAAGYHVRGGRRDQNLILLDEAVLYNPSHFFGIFSALNPFSTGSANIYKGAIPAKYGGRLSSVFDINTKDANSEKFAGEASIGPVTGNLVLEVPIVDGKSGLLLGARATYSDWILRMLDEPSLKNSEASFYDFVGKYNHTFNTQDRVQATAYYSKDRFSITSDSVFDYSNRLLSIQWNHAFDEKNTGNLQVKHSRYAFGIGYDGSSNTDFDLGYSISETGLGLGLKHLPGGTHTFDYGLMGKLYRVWPGTREPMGEESVIVPLRLPREQGLEGAIYLSDAYALNERLTIDMGLRYSFYFALGPTTQRIYGENAPRNASTFLETEEFDGGEVIKTYGGPELRLSTRYAFTPQFSIKGSYNNFYQYVHTLSNNTTAAPTDIWKLSDYYIRPQRADQFSLGLYRNNEDNTIELSLEGYYKRMDALLDYKVGAQLLMNQTLETQVLQGDGKAYGVEFLIRKKEGRLNGWLGYTYARSFVRLDGPFAEERVNDGDFFPSNFDRPHDLSVVANYRITKRFSFSANFVYQTGRPVTYPVGTYNFNNAEYVYYSDRNKFRIPDYYRLDLSFNVEGNHRIKKFAHSFWNISVYNVLGRNNPYSVFFVTDDGEIKAFQSSIFAIPIPTITYNFKF